MINFKTQVKEAERTKRKYLKRFNKIRITKHIRLRHDLYEKIKILSRERKSTISKTLDEIVDSSLCKVQE